MASETVGRAKVIGAITLVALGLRTVAALRTPVIAQDGSYYLIHARYFMEGAYRWWLSGWEPLYPMMAGIAGLASGDMEWGGKGVSILLGALSVVPLYFLLRRVFDETVATLASLFFATHPQMIKLSAEPLTDSSFIFFFLVATWQGYEAIRTRRLAPWAWAGASISAAYLIRPEGIGLGLLVGLWWLISLFRERQLSFAGWVTRPVILALAFLLLASPYIIYLKKDTGYWIITKRYSILSLVGIKTEHPIQGARKGIGTRPEGGEKSSGQRVPAFAPAPKIDPRVSLAGRAVEGASFIVKSFGLNLHLLLLALVVVGFFTWRARGHNRDGELFLASVIALYALAVFYLYLREGRHFVQGRYLATGVALSLGWAGAGLDNLRALVRARWSVRQASLVTVVGLLIIVTTMGAEGLRGRRQEKLYLIAVGQWIKSHSVVKPVVMTGDLRFPYYAGGIPVALLRVSAEEILDLAAETMVTHIVLQAGDQEYLGFDLKPHLEANSYRLLHSASDHKGRPVLVYASRYIEIGRWLRQQGTRPLRIASYDRLLAKYGGGKWVEPGSPGPDLERLRTEADFLVVDEATDLRPTLVGKTSPTARFGHRKGERLLVYDLRTLGRGEPAP